MSRPLINQNREIRIKAMDLLARREHSRAELQRKLMAKGFADDLINDVLATLAKENLQSDERFAENYVRTLTSRGYGPLRIGMELQERGVDSNIIAQFINKHENDWQAKAIAAKRKKFGNEIAENLRKKAKQVRFLQYRGFTGEQIKQALQDGMEPI